jgi:hypothetical protein
MFVTRRMLLEATWRRHGDSRGCYRRSCRMCGALLFASRPEARYCRPACRQRAYRQRLKLRRESAFISSPS